MQQDVGITDQQKAEKQGRDDSINSSVYNLTPHILNSGKICRVELCTELFYAIIPTLLFCCSVFSLVL